MDKLENRVMDRVKKIDGLRELIKGQDKEIENQSIKSIEIQPNKNTTGKDQLKRISTLDDLIEV